MGRIHASYYTDPASAESWGLEPALHRLAAELEDQLVVEPVMAGLAREFGPALTQVGAWLDVAESSGMPVDPRLWLASPPASSYPSCMAVKAAAEQGAALEAAYLRRLREGFACGRRKLDTRDALVAEAREVAGLDSAGFAVSLSSHAVVEAFGADLDRAGAVEGAVLDPDTGRARIPSLEFRGEDGRVHAVQGRASYEELRAAAQAAGAAFDGDADRPGVEDALRRFGTLATAEVAAVCDLPGPRAAAELWRLAGDWRVRSERRLTGELWSAA